MVSEEQLSKWQSMLLDTAYMGYSWQAIVSILISEVRELQHRLDQVTGQAEDSMQLMQAQLDYNTEKLGEQCGENGLLVAKVAHLERMIKALAHWCDQMDDMRQGYGPKYWILEAEKEARSK